MTISEMNQILRQARRTLDAADQVANDAAGMLRGRCRAVNGYRLAALKKELSQFNAHTKMWKEDK